MTIHHVLTLGFEKCFMHTCAICSLLKTVQDRIIIREYAGFFLFLCFNAGLSFPYFSFRKHKDAHKNTRYVTQMLWPQCGNYCTYYYIS